MVTPANPPLDRLVTSWKRHLKAGNVRGRTITSYEDSVLEFSMWLGCRGDCRDWAEVTKADVQDFVGEQLDRNAAATAARKFRELQQFFRWAVDEDEVPKSPMAGMRAPRVPVQPPPVLVEADAKAILKACEGRRFADRRDTAVVRVLLDTPARLDELAGLRLDPDDPRSNDVDLDRGLLRVLGKGGRERLMPIGNKTIVALDRYLRERALHSHASSKALWLGERGPLRSSGLYQALKRRARTAGVDAWTHLFRHTFAHNWLAGGGEEGDLMELAGWQDRTMLDRYGRSARGARAIEAHKRHSPGDRF